MKYRTKNNKVAEFSLNTSADMQVYTHIKFNY